MHVLPSVPRPDTTALVDWALRIHYLSIYLPSVLEFHLQHLAFLLVDDPDWRQSRVCNGDFSQTNAFRVSKTGQCCIGVIHHCNQSLSISTDLFP